MIHVNSASIEQCYQNIMALLLFHRVELPDYRIIAKLPDRVLLGDCSFPFHQLFTRGNGSFVRTSFRTPDGPLNPGEGATAVFRYRERVPRCALQLVAHSSMVWELSIDVFNPDYDLLSLAGHFLEAFRPGKANPYRIRKGLLKRGIGVPLIT